MVHNRPKNLIREYLHKWHLSQSILRDCNREICFVIWMDPQNSDRPQDMNRTRKSAKFRIIMQHKPSFSHKLPQAAKTILRLSAIEEPEEYFEFTKEKALKCKI
eukprot:TRINITY_DN11040_c0_g1_i4.p2 TRINITY_DN11040_c0_g1~~TRINITY_DN11040_c0_g1_i4.p2  ORF type:complete len:104 (-),score=20.01 TRINITY_DN11040_c0_g1_i4:126-437(-)